MTLRKYCPITVYSLENVANMQLNLTPPKYFNDPFDCYFLKKIDDLKNLPEDWKKYLLDLKILSLCNEDVLKKECAEKIDFVRRHFWSFYADAHKGICIEFVIPDEKFKDKNFIYDLQLTRGVFSFTPNCFFSRQVLYEPVFENLCFISDGTNLNSPQSLLETAIFRKDYVFKAEEEFRIGLIPKDEKTLFPVFDIKEFTPKIIFGLECEEKHKQVIATIGKNNYLFYEVNEKMEESVYAE